MKKLELPQNWATMSQEEKEKFFKDFSYDDGADEIARLKKANDDLAKENAKKKQELQDKLSEDEKKKLANDELIETLKKQNEELKKEKQLASLVSKNIALGMDETKARELANAYYDGNTEDYYRILGEFNKSRESAIKQELLKNGGIPPKDNGNKTVSYDDFKKMTYTQQVEFQASNPILYQEYTNKK